VQMVSMKGEVDVRLNALSCLGREINCKHVQCTCLCLHYLFLYVDICFQTFGHTKQLQAHPLPVENSHFQ